MTPEYEALRMQLQTNGANLIRTDIRLGFTFLDLARVEKTTRDHEASARSLYHAQRAHLGAQNMLRLLPRLDEDERTAIQKDLRALREAAIAFADAGNGRE